jgi:hypothetical protein
MAEDTLKKCEAVNASIKRFEAVDKEMGREAAMLSLPTYLLEPEGANNICPKCNQRFICQPPIKRVETEIVADEEMTEKFERMMELKPVGKELKELEDEFKKFLEGRNVMLGNWMCQGKWVERKGYTAEIKPSKYWKIDYMQIEEGKK